MQSEVADTLCPAVKFTYSWILDFSVKEVKSIVFVLNSGGRGTQIFYLSKNNNITI